MRHVHIVAALIVFVVAGCSGSRNSVVPIASSPPGSGARQASVTTSGPYPTAVLSNNPVAYYRLGDQGTTAATDSSGNNHIGTYNGLGTALTQGTAGLIAGDTTTSTTSNGNGAGSVKIARSPAFESANVSIEVWVKLSANTTTVQVLAQYGNWQNFRGYALDYDGPHSAFALKLAINSGNRPATTIEPTSGAGFKPQVGSIYHVVGTYNGSAATLYVNGQVAANAALSGSINYAPANKNAGLTIFEDAGNASPTSGALQEVAFYNTALSGNSVLTHYNAGTSAPPPVVHYTDWNTFGDNLQRTGFNGNETTLSASNAGSLRELWATDLGGAITAQPLVATAVSLPTGTTANVLYVGAENNIFYAVNADTGAFIWKNTNLGTPLATGCGDLPNGQFGITGTAVYDRNAGSNGVVYVADANDYIHALDMATGIEQWKVNILLDPNTGTIVGAPSQDHIYGALALNNGMLYAYTASLCDVAPWHGRIVAISTATHNVVAAFFPGRSGSGKSGTAYCGGGIWGMGGASIDTSGNVYVATGNTVTTTSGGCLANSAGETYPYGDAVIQLDSQLNLLSYATATANGVKVSGDSDYGATPMLYNVPSCPSLQLSAKNKNGYLYTYAVTGSGLTAEQQLHIGNTSGDGQFIGVPSFDPSAGLVYVGNPNANTNANYANGLNALQQNSGGCAGLTLAWKASIGTANATSDDNQAPTGANGVVYFTDGIDNQVWAFDSLKGTQLWHSGINIGSPCINPVYGGPCGVFGAATVDGRLFVGAWNHNLYAFTP